MQRGLREVLGEMDQKIADRERQPTIDVTDLDLSELRAALAAALERIDRLEQAARLALDAYLLRPPASGMPAALDSNRPPGSRQKYMQRVSEAMAGLEMELAEGGSGKASKKSPAPPTSGG